MVLFRHNLMRAEFLQSDTEEWNRQKSRDELGGAGGGGVCLISYEQRFFFECCFLIFQGLFCSGHNSLWFDGGGMDFDGEFHERNNHVLKMHSKKNGPYTPHFIAFNLILIRRHSYC